MRKHVAVLLAVMLVLTTGLVAPTNTLASPDPGIVGLWHLDGNALDSSGLGNNGQVLSGATFVPGMPEFGQALRRTTDNYSMRVLDNPSLDITTELAIGVYVKFDSFADRWRLVGKVMPPPSTQDSFMLDVGTDARVRLTVWKSPTEFTTVVGNTILNTNEWYHIGGSYKFLTDGTSVLKISVRANLDGIRYDAVGPIFSGTAPLMMGRLAGTIDEIRLWNAPHAMWGLAATPSRDVNPAGGDHTITATVSPVAPGVRVLFDITSGPNAGESAGVTTNGQGQAVWTYHDDSAAGGLDIIRVWIDRDQSRTFNPPEDVAVGVRKSWVANFLTGGGKVNAPVGKKTAFTFGGTVGVLPGGGVDGEFQVVDHGSKVAYHFETFGQLVFSGGPAESPSAKRNTALFIGRARGNDGTTVRLRVTIQDLGEPGAGVDRIKIEQLPPTPPPEQQPWPPPPEPIVATWVDSTIDSGNFQVHDTQ